jgi:hypothetical protein
MYQIELIPETPIPIHLPELRRFDQKALIKLGSSESYIWANKTTLFVDGDLEIILPKSSIWTNLTRIETTKPESITMSDPWDLWGYYDVGIKQKERKQKPNRLREHSECLHEAMKFPPSLCLHCHSAPPSGLMLPCKHSCCCLECAHELSVCPVCKTSFELLNVYLMSF